MKTSYKFRHRVLSWVLAVSLILSLFPLQVLVTRSSAAENGGVTLTADKATLDAWKELFPIDDPSTANAGKVWMDKSVVAGNMTFGDKSQTEITREQQDSFLVALSTIAATKSITGVSYTPTDTMLVLDVSGSMGSGDNGNKQAGNMVAAANKSIKSLLEANKYNRVGVVIYSGPHDVNGATSNTDAVLLLPLGRYETGSNGEYLSYSKSNGTEKVSLNSNTKIEGTNNKPTVSTTSKQVKGGTYIQKGLIMAMNQFTATSNSTTVVDSLLGTLNRKPILVLMSDGAPTVGSTDFTNPGNIIFGTGQENEVTAGLVFATQLTASYAKAMIEQKYGADSCLFYSLGLGVSGNSNALSVLDPENEGTATANYWKTYEKTNVGEKVNVGKKKQSGGGKDQYITKIDTVLEHYYVDKYFSANDADSLMKAFKNIVENIQLQSSYFPTLVEQDEDLSGYVSFADNIGRYMEVTDIKGILMDNKLYSGAEMAKTIKDIMESKNFEDGLGKTFLDSVKRRLGIASDEIAETLINQAWEKGQLRYVSDTNYSNYISWVADKNQKFLGFYTEGTDLTQFDGATYIVRSYGYMGETDESHGVAKSDMMYTTVRVMTKIETQEVIVAFAVPAALVPVVNYKVTLGEDQQATGLEVEGAKEPIRLIYEVALRSDINPYTVKEIVSADYLAETGSVDEETGAIHFFTNRWDRVNPTGYGTVNTYGYFNPSTLNEHYYYQEHCYIYQDAKGTPYMEAEKPSGTVYRGYTVYYKENGKVKQKIEYHEINPETLELAVKEDSTGKWYIPAGSIRRNPDDSREKEQNATGTLEYFSKPFVDVNDKSVQANKYYVGATLGNNGRITIQPATGIKLTKTMANGVATPNETFTFKLENVTGVEDTAYTAWRVSADGTGTTETVRFIDGQAEVRLKAGEILYIDLPDGAVLQITEEDTLEYMVETTAGLTDGNTVTVKKNELQTVEFVNGLRGTGNVTIGKEILHDLGDTYQIPDNKTFTIKVTLSGVGTAEREFEMTRADNTTATITTDANGSFMVPLKHGEQVQISGLPTGTKVTVVEQNVPDGFTAGYLDDGVAGDGIVYIEKDHTSDVTVTNRYQPKEVYPVNLKLEGTKIVLDQNGDPIPLEQWLDTYQFTIVLERKDDGEWVEIATETVNKNQQTFSFTEVLQNEKYTKPGEYVYQVREVIPDNDQRIDGMSYDRTWYTFTVYVGDDDMDGRLEITSVRYTSNGNDIQQVNGVYTIQIDIKNQQKVNAFAWANIAIQKKIKDLSGSDPKLNGFQFGLFDEDGNEIKADGEIIKTIETGNSDSSGEAQIKIELLKTGTYTYYVKEKVPANGIPGMSYSTEAVPVTITVVQNGSRLEATVSYQSNDDHVTITNTYKAKPTTLPIDFVSKVLTGRDLVAGEFTFEVRGADGVVLKGSNDASGKVTFDGVLSFDKVGEYHYTIVETSESGNGVSIDSNAYRLVVKVTDVDGQLVATPTVSNVPGNQIVFQNTYTPKSVSVVIGGKKILNGKTLFNDMFSFLLTEISENGDSALNLKASNRLDGTFQFEPIMYTKVGTYSYKVTENKGKLPGITYDESVFTVTVVVTDDGKGQLLAEVAITKGDMPVDEIRFVNDYKPAPADKELSGNKELTGKVDNGLTGGEFSFDLYKSDETWAQGEKLETVANGQGGTIKFQKLTFEEAGTYYYLVKEVDGGRIIGGITYDSRVYRVKIVVTDDNNGQLVATENIYIEDVPVSEIRFTNRYTVTGEENVPIAGQKFLEGRKLTEQDVFEFELYQKNDSGKYELVDTIPMGADGRFSHALHYTAADVGRTYAYMLKEKNAGKEIGGVSYSTTEYFFTVKIEDNDVGGIKTTVESEADIEKLRFTNVYTAKPAELPMDFVSKILDGRVLKDGEFTFEVRNADGETVLKGTNNAAGKVTFDGKLSFEKVGVYSYTIVETGKNGDGVTIDESVFTLTVTVTDDGKGRLHAAKSITRDNDTVDAVQFVNKYTITQTDKITISGNKELNGRPMTEQDAFVFELFETESDFKVAENAQPVASATVDPVTGKYSLVMTYGAADIGVKHYVLREKNAGKEIDGVTYDTREYQITVTVEDNGKGGVVATAVTDAQSIGALNFTNGYSAKQTKTTFKGHKVLTGIRPLKENDFLFELYQAGEDFSVIGDAIQSVRNDQDGKFSFETVEFKTPGVYYFVVKENSQSPIGGVSYDAAMYQITVWVVDNGKGQLEISDTAMTRVLGEESADVEKILFTNDYDPDSATVNLGGQKILSGRELLSGEFNFNLYVTDGDFQINADMVPMVAINKEDGSFVFDALTFTEAKTYYFVICENQTVQAERITFDDTVYQVTIEVKDDENGKLVASEPKITIAGSDELAESVVFTNVYTPKPADITVDIGVDKTVVNKGGNKIGPENFLFLLKELDAKEGVTVKSDKDGKAVFTLRFTEDDIGKIYRYQLTEVNDARPNVTYSNVTYDITITISLGEDNCLVAQIQQNEKVVEQVVAAFENVYDYTEPSDDPPKTGDGAALSLYLTMMGIACGAAIMLICGDSKKKVR